MAQTDTKPGFRLPWTAERTESDAPPEDQTSEPRAAADPPAVEETETPRMIDAADAAVPDAAVPDTAEPDTAVVTGGRRPTKFMAELSRAMQAAAETARIETIARFEAEAKSVVEEIHAASAVEAANVRRQADDDVASVREWSKAEIARIREETEARIVLRKTALDGETEAHAGVVQARIERVGATVSDYETQMTTFIARLMAEEDPTRIATMAEMMPDPPNLAGVAASVGDATVTPFRPMPDAIPAWSAETEGPAEAPVPADVVAPADLDQLIAAARGFAAAEAEAAAFTGDLDDDGGTEDGREDAAAEELVHVTAPVESPLTAARATARVVVVGLVSVASIATFKRTLSRVAGVAAIGVASGPDGEFVFTVSHDAGLDLAEAITGLAGFETRITAETADGLEVAARDADAAG